MYKLSAKTQKMLVQDIGLSMEEIARLDLAQERAHIEKKNGSLPVFSREKRPGVFGRGNPCLAQKRICTMEDVNARLDGI